MEVGAVGDEVVVVVQARLSLCDFPNVLGTLMGMVQKGARVMTVKLRPLLPMMSP